MATYRINKNRDNPYVILNSGFLKRPDLSMKAKGLLAYFLSLPNDWKIIRKELPSNFKDNITAVNNAIKELEGSGYILRHQKRNEFLNFYVQIFKCSIIQIFNCSIICSRGLLRIL